MEGPLDPPHPGHDAAPPEVQDDLHALLERLLGQGDVRPSAPGDGDDLWPELFAAAPVADEVSTVVPLPEARAWEPVLVDPSSTTTNVDDIHAAILASVSVDLQPIIEEAPLVEPVIESEPVETMTVDLAPADLPTAPEADLGDAAFVLTPFEAVEPEAAADPHADAEALWAAATPAVDLEVAPLLDLEALDSHLDDAPTPVTAVVLPWPTQDAKADAATPAAHDLIEAALSGLHADLTSEAVEPLRTPDVAVSTAHVVFRLGTRSMAIPLAAVSEIARPPKVTRLPHVPAWVLGIANLRGDIVSMLDLEGFFSGNAGKSSHEQRMLALRPAGDEVRTAVLVDSVDGIKAFEDARIARVTRGYDAEVAPYARGLYQVEDDLVVVIDADRLLQSKPMRQFEDGAGAR
jgi:chemotaxis signal transduction protein